MMTRLTIAIIGVGTTAAAGIATFVAIRKTRAAVAPVAAPPTVQRIAVPYVTRLENVIVPAWVQVGNELQTVTPLLDSAGGYARLNYAGALAAAAANNADLISRAGVETRSDAARAKNLELSPITLPDIGMMRAAGIDPKDRKAVGAFLNANMRSKEWAKVHDDRAHAQLKSRGWDGVAVTSNIGKPWVGGAAPGRGRLFGWRQSNGSWIQPEESAHDDAWTDYATTTILRRPL